MGKMAWRDFGMLGMHIDCKMKTQNNFRRPLTALGILVPLVWCMGFPTAAQTRGQDMLNDLLEAFPKEVLHANFTMRRTTPLLEGESVSTGKLTRYPGGRIQWETHTPESSVVEYTPKDTLANRFPFPTTMEFQVHVKSLGKGEVVLTLVPLRAPLSKLFSRIQIQLEERSKYVREVWLYGREGDKTRISFAQIEVEQVQVP